MASRFHGLALWLALAAIATPVAAQEQPATFEFSFSNPGARSLGFGGAFAALADDATAAFANPAGLVQLIEPELSAELRASSRRTEFVEGGRVSGEPSGQGVDTVAGLRRGVFETDQTEVPFAAFVYPVKRVSFAVYRQIWADFSLSSRIDGLFGVEDGEGTRAGDIGARVRVEVVNSGLAAAYKVTERWSLGLGVVYYEALMRSVAEEFSQDEEAFYEPSEFSADRLDTTYSHRAEDSGLSLHAGFLGRVSARWSIGGYFRQGPEMTLRVVETAGPAEEDFPEGTVVLDETSPLRLPDVYGLGVAYRSQGGAWTVSCEWSRVRYSLITDGLDVDVIDPRQVELSDGDEFHLGLERVFARSRPIVALRLGAWLDPAHRVVAGPNADPFEEAVFQAADDEIHATGGVGLVFERFQLDLGADLSDRADFASLSLVYRF